MKRPYVPELTPMDWAVIGGGLVGYIGLVYLFLYLVSGALTADPRTLQWTID